MLKKKFIYIILIILTFLAASEGFSASYQKYYNPFLAGSLSWYSAGLGQIYNEQYVKGGVFFIIDNSLLLLALNSIAEINFNIDETFGFNMNIQLKKEKEIEYNSLPATFFFVSYLAFHFYNVFDAVVVSAKRNFDISLDYKPAENQIALSYTYHFF